MKWGVRKQYVPHPRKKRATLSRSGAELVAKRIHNKVMNDSSEPTGNQNCQLCTWTTEAQFRGLDILPRAVYSPRDIIFDKNGYDIVKDPVKEGIKSKADVIRKVIDAGDGARFYTHVNWAGSQGGHEFIVANLGGEAVLIDSQAGISTGISKKAASGYFDDINYTNSFLVRMDNREINRDILKYNDERYLTRWDWDADVAYLKAHGMIDSDEVSHSNLSDGISEKILSLLGKASVLRLFGDYLSSFRLLEELFGG